MCATGKNIIPRSRVTHSWMGAKCVSREWINKWAAHSAPHRCWCFLLNSAIIFIWSLAHHTHTSVSRKNTQTKQWISHLAKLLRVCALDVIEFPSCSFFDSLGISVRLVALRSRCNCGFSGKYRLAFAAVFIDYRKQQLPIPLRNIFSEWLKMMENFKLENVIVWMLFLFPFDFFSPSLACIN